MKIILASALIASSLTLFASNAAQASSQIDCQEKLSVPTAVSDLYNDRGEELTSLSKQEKNALTAAQKVSGEFENASTQDETLFLDECAVAFYREELPDRPQSMKPSVANFPLSDTFDLSSKPGSSKTIYLDFTGETVSNTAWNQSMNQSVLVASPYSIDSSPGFSSGELANIQEIWKDVAQDYSNFDVNVTTKEPLASELGRSNSSDQIYGLKALISGSNELQTNCGCGGIAYLGITTFSGSNFDYYSNAWVFADRLYTPHNVAQATSHELGHNLALQHDGYNSQGYYNGHGIWGPLMGAPYNRPLTQWSNGDYAGANNSEDDISIIGQSFNILNDDHGSDFSSASSLVSASAGMISSNADADFFVFNASDNTAISATVDSYSNLDVKLTLYDSAKNVIVVNDPPSATYSDTKALGLEATINRTLSPGLYYLKIEGTSSVASPGPYSNYGSVGAYNLQLTTTVGPPTSELKITTTNLPSAQQGQNYQSQIFASGGTAPYTFSSQGLPSGLSISSDGIISGQSSQNGSFPVTITVTDSSSIQVSRLFSLEVTGTSGYDSIAITSPLTFETVTAKEVSFSLTASGGAGNYSWVVSNLPNGLKVVGNEITGVTHEAGVFTGTVSVTSVAPGGQIFMANKSYSLTILANTELVKPSFVTKSISSVKKSKRFTRYISVKSESAVTWRKTKGHIPRGVTMKKVMTASGIKIKVSGKPKRSGIYRFTIELRNDSGTVSRNFILRVKK